MKGVPVIGVINNQSAPFTSLRFGGPLT